VLEGLTTAIIVDQERMGANSPSTVGTATDANAMPPTPVDGGENAVG
jgi:excinuclease UvrABC ATPase subunit